MWVASFLGGQPSFHIWALYRPLGSRIIRYVRHRRTHGQTDRRMDNSNTYCSLPYGRGDNKTFYTCNFILFWIRYFHTEIRVTRLDSLRLRLTCHYQWRITTWIETRVYWMEILLASLCSQSVTLKHWYYIAGPLHAIFDHNSSQTIDRNRDRYFEQLTVDLIFQLPEMGRFCDFASVVGSRGCTFKNSLLNIE